MGPTSWRPPNADQSGWRGLAKWILPLLIASLLSPLPATACRVFGNGWGSKWDGPVWPAGAIISWSFMTPGVALGPSAPAGWSGVNTQGSGGAADIRVIIDSVHGAGAFDAAVQRAFDTWAATANLQFMQVADQRGEGDALQTRPGGIYLNDVEGLLLHESGRTLGIGHSAVTKASGRSTSR